jgi:hypothetical protein
MKLHCEWMDVWNRRDNLTRIVETKQNHRIYAVQHPGGTLFTGCFLGEFSHYLSSIEEAQHWCELQLAHKFAEEICEGDG